MAQLKSKAVDEARGWYSDTRYTAGAEVGLHALELAAQKLLDVSTAEAPSEEQLRNALSGYVELTESVKGVEDTLQRVQLMLRVVGQNLMGKV